MFSKATVGKKIVFGFFTVLLLLIAVVMIAYTSLNKAADGFEHYRDLARDTNLAGRLQANMLMARLAASNHTVSQKDEFLKEYEERYEKMKQFIDLSKKEIRHSERAAQIHKIDSAHKKYHIEFRKVAENIRKRDEYVEELIDVKGPFMVKTLTDIMTSVQENDDMTASLYLKGFPRFWFLLLNGHKPGNYKYPYA